MVKDNEVDTYGDDADDDADDDGPKQTISRMPPDRPDVGPFFPSGMSAPEAAMAGATAGMSDDQLEKIDKMKGEYGVGEGEEDVE